MMEPTEPHTPRLDLGVDPPTRLTQEPGPGRRRRPARVALAAVGAIVLVAAAIGVISATGNHGSRARLVLDPNGSSPAKELPAAADASGGTRGSSPYRFRLAVSDFHLGSDAPVARLEPPNADDTRVAAMAAALGLRGAVTGTTGAGRQVTDGSARLTVEPVPGGWAVSYGLDAGGSSPGSDGSGGSTGSGSSGSGSTTEQPPETKIDPRVPSPTVTQPPAVNLPEPAAAERTARSLLDRMGITGEWSATTIDAASDGVVCAPEPCAAPDHVVVTSRTVELRPRLAGVAVDGLSWQITMGDNGDIVAVFGTWTSLRTLDRYPLRTVASVFADLEAGKGVSPDPVPIAATDLGAPIEPDATPITVTIDHVALGFTVFPASDDGVAVVDVVPTYVFTGTMSGGGDFRQALVAVDATVVPPADPTTPPTKPIAVSPPSGRPEPQPAPLPESTVSGKPPT